MYKFIWKSCFLEFDSSSRGGHRLYSNSVPPTVEQAWCGIFSFQWDLGHQDQQPCLGRSALCIQVHFHTPFTVGCLLHRPCAYSQGCFSGISDPEIQKIAQTLSGQIKDSLEQEEESSAQKFNIWALLNIFIEESEQIVDIGEGQHQKRLFQLTEGKIQRDTSISLSHCTATDKQETYPYRWVLVLSCAKQFSQLVHDCPHLHQMSCICTAQAYCGTGSRHTAFLPQHPQTALHIHVHLQAASPYPEASVHFPHGRNTSHSPVPRMFQKRLPGTVTPDSLALPIPCLRDHSRTPSPGPRNPTPICLTTKLLALTLTWPSWRLPAHMQKAATEERHQPCLTKSITGPTCPKVHFTQLKTHHHILWDRHIELNITKRKPLCHQSAATLRSSSLSLFRVLNTSEVHCEKSNLYLAS